MQVSTLLFACFTSKKGLFGLRIMYASKGIPLWRILILRADVSTIAVVILLIWHVKDMLKN
ncbi:MAG TPA: hypothetical protein VNM45_07830 [Bacillus sp. (in: firmicutes)]|nr:hypothetical protein [Bacillus sp. (in: firmicutes)]